MTNYWVVRAGEGGKYAYMAKNSNHVAIGWYEMGDLSWLADSDEELDTLRETFTERFKEVFQGPGVSKGSISLNSGQVFKFVKLIKINDNVLLPNWSEPLKVDR